MYPSTHYPGPCFCSWVTVCCASRFSSSFFLPTTSRRQTSRENIAGEVMPTTDWHSHNARKSNTNCHSRLRLPELKDTIECRQKWSNFKELEKKSTTQPTLAEVVLILTRTKVNGLHPNHHLETRNRMPTAMGTAPTQVTRAALHTGRRH